MTDLGGRVTSAVHRPMIVNHRLSGLPRNCIGPVIPTRDADALVRIFEIPPDARVLEVGGGFFPFARADVITDLTFSDASNRNGAEMMFRADKTYVECPAEALPFEDRTFDFVFCAHVLEHVADPERAMREMARVAPRGFVEVPSAMSDYVSGNPTHRWLITLEDDTLVFRPRNFLEVPLRSILHAPIYNDPAFEAVVHGEYRNLFNLQVAWEGEIPFRVEPETHGPRFDYDDPVQAGWSHLLFALNLFRYDTDPKYAIADAIEATRFVPDAADAWTVRGLYETKLLLLDEAARSFARAIELAPDDKAARHNAAIVERARESGAFDPGELTLPAAEPPAEAFGSSGGDTSRTHRTPRAGDERSSDGGAPDPLVSVVFDAPDDGAAFDAMFESLVVQRYERREIIVVTTDLDAARARIDRLRTASSVRFVSVDAGAPLGVRLNAGFAQCRGDYTAYLTHDSIWRIEHLSRLVDRLEGSRAAAAYADALRISFAEDDDGKRRYGWAEDCVLAPTLEAGKLASDEPIPVSTLMHRREIFAGFDAGLDRLIGRDFLLRIARHAAVEHVREITSEYRARCDDLGSDEERTRRLAEQRRVLANYSQFEPLELMRRVVELYNKNADLEARLARHEASVSTVVESREP